MPMADDDGAHAPVLVFFGDRHSIPAEVCGTCSNQSAGRWVPVTACPSAAAQLDAPGDADRLNGHVVHLR
jgi:hypothetical protein